MSAGVVRPPASDFSERLVGGFFRRWFFYLIPILLFTAVGINSARSLTGEFASYARLSATTNPYLDQPDIRGTELGFLETPAQGTARLINEQLQTDAFIDEVATRAGLDQAVEAGALRRDIIRSRVVASPSGQNNLTVSATWVDPTTAFALVDATTRGYGEYLNELAVADSLEAVEFWTDRRQAAEAEAARAEETLNNFIRSLPPLAEGDDRPTEQVLELQRLSAELDRALTSVREGQGAIDEAQFNANQAASSSAREFVVVDAPEVPVAPEPVRRDQMLRIAAFGLLGVIISLAALVITTVTDRSIRTRSQLRVASGIDVVASIPRVRQLRRKRRSIRNAEGRAA